MKKIQSKIMSFALCVLLCAGFCVPVLATEYPSDTNNGESIITVTASPDSLNAGEATDVTVTVTLGEAIECSGFNASVSVPSGWSTNANSIKATLSNDEDQKAGYNSSQNTIAKALGKEFGADGNEYPLVTGFTIKYTVSSEAEAGNQTVGLTNLEIKKVGLESTYKWATATTIVNIEEPEHPADGYTVALSTDAASEGVTKEDTFNLKLNVTNSDSTIKDFSAFHATLKYNPTLVTFEGGTASQSDVDVDVFKYDNDSTAGTLKITRVGSEVNITDNPELTLPFKAKAEGNAEFTFEGIVKVSKADEAEGDAKVAAVGDPVTVTVKEVAEPKVTNVKGTEDTDQPSFAGSGEQTKYQEIIARIENGEGYVPYYGEQIMYKVVGYDTDKYYCVFPAEEIYADSNLICKPGDTITIEKTINVNETTVTDINDAQFVYNIYNGAKPSDNVVMRLIKADTNRDQNINMSDCAVVVQGL